MSINSVTSNQNVTNFIPGMRERPAHDGHPWRHLPGVSPTWKADPQRLAAQPSRATSRQTDDTRSCSGLLDPVVDHDCFLSGNIPLFIFTSYGSILNHLTTLCQFDKLNLDLIVGFEPLR